MRKFVLLAAPLAFFAATPIAAQSEPAPQSAEQKPVAAEDPDQKIKCRRIEITGSLVRKERVCKTVAEWRANAESGNQNARDVVDHSRGRPSGGN